MLREIWIAALGAIVCLAGNSAHAYQGMPVPKLQVAGRFLRDPNGRTVLLHGYMQPGASWFNGEGKNFSDPTDFTSAANVAPALNFFKDVAQILSTTTAQYGSDHGWTATFVRFIGDQAGVSNFAPGWDVNGNLANSAQFNGWIQNVLVPYVDYCRSVGLYVVICGNPSVAYPGGDVNKNMTQQYQNHLITFWQTVASASGIKSAANVMFEICNEPITIEPSFGANNWGSGSSAYWSALKTFMQPVVDAVRITGADNIIMVPSLGWQGECQGFASFPISGANIAYSGHYYPAYGSVFDDATKVQNLWNTNYKPAADLAPLFITELWWNPNNGQGYQNLWNAHTSGFGNAIKTAIDNQGNVSYLIGMVADLLANITSGLSATTLSSGEGAQAAFDWWPTYQSTAPGGTAVAPALTTQPSNATVTTGSSVTMRVNATGTPAPTYQWRKDGANLTGATDSSLTLRNVSAGDAGSYTCVATNSSGSVTSSAATLTVIAAHPTKATVTTGHSIQLDAGTVTGSIQWQISTNNGTTWSNLTEGSSYTGTTSTVLEIVNATAALNNAQFRYVATNGSGTATSSPITLAVSAALVPFPTGIVADNAGNLCVCDANTDTVQKVNSSGQVSLLAGTSGTSGSDDGTGSAARFNQPNGVVLLNNSSLVVADLANATLRSITGTGVVMTLAGKAGVRGNLDGTGTAATFSAPVGLAVDGAGNLYVADSMNHTIRKATSTGVITTLAGVAGVSGSTDARGTAARFNLPNGVAVDSMGNVYVADTTNNTIRKIDTTGAVTTLAGLAGVSGSSDGTGAGALFNHPTGLAVDGAGNLYLADTGNSTIRRITPAGVVTTIAGLPGLAGLEDGTSGDGTYALFSQPQALCLDSGGNLYVADTGNAAIRKIDLAANVTTLVLTKAGSDTGGGGGTGGGSGGGPTPAPSSGGGGGGGSCEAWFALAVVLGLLVKRRGRAR